MIRFPSTCTAVAVAVALAFAAPLAATVPASAAGNGSTLRIEADTTFSTFNPFTAYYASDLNIIANIYPALTQTGESGQPVPYLATSWSTSADKLTWTFKIRTGLKWTDGVPLTAQDIAWTYNLVMTNQAAGTANGSLVSNFASVSAPNASTFVITTKKPQSNITYTSIPVVPEHVWKSHVANLANFKNMSFPVVGYGPWILSGYVSNQYTTMTANSDYYQGPPKYHTLITQYFTSSDAGIAALRSGQLDVIDDLTPTQYEALKGTKDITLYPAASNSWNAIELNPGARTRGGKHFGNGNPALQNQQVRDAIALAINRNVLLSKVADGLGVAGAGFLTPAFPQWWWTPPSSGSYAYDPARAKQMLDAAGYKMGSGGVRLDPKTHKPLNLRLGIHSDNAYDSLIAPYVVEWLQAIGIKVTVQAMSFTQLNTDLPKGDWDILMDTWATGADPSYLLSIESCATLPTNQSTPGNTDAFYCNPAYDSLYNDQLTEFNQAQRAQIVDQMQSILYNANVDIILYYPDTLQAVRTADVKDFMFGKPDSQGFYPQQNNWINWRTAAPMATASAGSNTGLYVGIPIAAVVLIAAGILITMRRRASAGERE